MFRDFDIEAIRSDVRAMDFERGTPEQVARWREADEDSRHNHFIEGIEFTPNEGALFDMMLDEAVPPELVTQIVGKLLDADLLADYLIRHSHDADGRAVLLFDAEAVRARVQEMDFVRGTPAQVEGWREADAGRRAYLISKGLMVEPMIEDGLFAMFMDEAVPPDLCATIVRDLRDRPAAAR